MIASDLMWLATFTALLAAFISVLVISKEKRFAAYFAWGAVFGLLIDYFSTSQGYYKYHLLQNWPGLGFPATVIIAEGFAVAITIFAYEEVFEHGVLGRLLRHRKKKKGASAQSF
ncbi:hypothetical protein HYU15_01320 [Candidatus Woesearchaeota archaeon]|nr:hypothetical protein [Candidatus Woesearchaeota archaeon]